MFGDISMIGYKETTIDIKNRIVLPSFTKVELNDSVMIVNENCNYISIYPLELLSQRLKKLRQAIINNPTIKSELLEEIESLLFSQVRKASTDSQKRIVIPIQLLEEKGIVRNCIIQGADDHIRVWNPDLFRNTAKKYIKDKIIL